MNKLDNDEFFHYLIKMGKECIEGGSNPQTISKSIYDLVNSHGPVITEDEIKSLFDTEE